jgi:hypothetical protein
MKEIMLMVYGICFVLAQSTASAQGFPFHSKKKNMDYDFIGAQVPNPQTKTKSYGDTLIMNLQGSDKILFIGKYLRQMVRYQKADSLKMLFLNDFEKAVSEGSITKEVQRIHYFVHGSGKRRLKAETPEYTDSKVDVDYEIKRLNFDIPKYHYVIHDLSSRFGYELHIYINDPEQIRNILTAVNLNEAIHSKEIDKETIRTCYKVEINIEDDNYKIRKKTGSWKRMILPNGNFGISMLGNLVSPMLGANLEYIWLDKYAVGKNKIGLGFNVRPIVYMNSGKITGISMVNSYDLILMHNNEKISHGESWTGLQVGFMKSNELSPFNNAFKWGAVFEKPKYGFSFDFIRDRNRNMIYGVTFKLPF